MVDGRKPSIAVIIDSYNMEQYLRAAVESVLAQDEPPDEFVVVDDGSTDGSRQILDDFGPRVRVLHQDNQGQAGAFNTGLASVTSDVVLLLDADDLLLPGAIRTIRQSWHCRAAKLHWPMVVVDSSGDSTGRVVPEARLPRGELAEQLLTEGPSSVVLASPPTSGNAFALSALQPFLPIPVSEWPEWPDTYLLTVAPLGGEVLAVDVSLSCYRVHGTNASASGGPRGQAERAVGYVRDSGALLARLRPDRVDAADVASWVAESWAGRGLALLDLVAREVPVDSPVLLLDDWETGWTELEGRPVLRPGDDGAEDVRHVVVPWWQTGSGESAVTARAPSAP